MNGMGGGGFNKKADIAPPLLLEGIKGGLRGGCSDLSYDMIHQSPRAHLQPQWRNGPRTAGFKEALHHVLNQEKVKERLSCREDWLCNRLHPPPGLVCNTKTSLPHVCHTSVRNFTFSCSFFYNHFYSCLLHGTFRRMFPEERPIYTTRKGSTFHQGEGAAFFMYGFQRSAGRNVRFAQKHGYTLINK